MQASCYERRETILFVEHDCGCIFQRNLSNQMENFNEDNRRNNSDFQCGPIWVILYLFTYQIDEMI